MQEDIPDIKALDTTTTIEQLFPPGVSHSEEVWVTLFDLWYSLQVEYISSY